MQDGGHRPNWTYQNRNNSAEDCAISQKFGTWVQVVELLYL